MAADCEIVAHELSTRLFNVDAYLRLKAEVGMENMCIDNWLELGDIDAHTRIYFENPAVSEALESSLRRLQDRNGGVTLGHISMYTLVYVPSIDRFQFQLFRVVLKSQRRRLQPCLPTSSCERSHGNYWLNISLIRPPLARRSSPSQEWEVVVRHN